ncbi:uncharacterized protein ACB058_010685 [Synchiropus picturatus]
MRDVLVKDAALKAQLKNCQQRKLQSDRRLAEVRRELQKLDSQLKQIQDCHNREPEQTLTHLQEQLFKLVMTSKKTLEEQAVKIREENQILRCEVEDLQAKLSS